MMKILPSSFTLMCKQLSSFKISLLLSIGFVILISSSLEGQSVIRGPYLQSGTSNSMVIKWRTNTETTSKIWFSTSLGLLENEVVASELVEDHEIKISGLSPGTKYYYAIGRIDSIFVGNDAQHYFKTSPIPGDSGNYRAWIMGDCGTGNEKARSVRDAFYQYNGSEELDMIIMLGDNAYEDGRDWEYQDAVFENSYEDVLINSVLWPCPGNHDYGHDAVDGILQTGPYYDIFTLPKNGEAGGVPSNTEAYYSFDYGNVHIVSLDSYGVALDVDGPMAEWLETDLAATDKKWKIVFFHHPPFSKGSHDTDDRFDSSGRMWDMRSNLVPIFESHHVDLVLSGHSHSYERSHLAHGHYEHTFNFEESMILDDGDGKEDGDGPYEKFINGNGTVYTVQGNAGKLGSGNLDHPIMYFGVEELGSTILNVEDDELSMEFLNSDGIIRDYFTISKEDGPCPNAGSSCNDGNPVTINDVYDNECTCRGISLEPLTVCRYIANGEDDAEENGINGRVTTSSNDLELTFDNKNGDSHQIVGLQYSSMRIPKFADILSATVQFTADEENDDSTSLHIYAEKTGDPVPFQELDFDLSSRTLTSTSVSWQPAIWDDQGAVGDLQKTVDFRTVIQEVVELPDYDPSSTFSIIIKGIGERTAESFEGGISRSPKFCVTYHPCLPEGNPCDDFNACTMNDVFDADCHCTGTLMDSDSDGVCDSDDLCPGFNDQADQDNDGIPDACDDCDGAGIGTPCNDNNNCTIQDVVDDNCECNGTFMDSDNDSVCDADDVCEGFDDLSDFDNDGIPDGCEDCDFLLVGQSCNDNDPCTINEVYDAECNCIGNFNDTDNDGVCNADDLCPDFNDQLDVDNDGIPDGCDDCNGNFEGGVCNDGDVCTINDVFDSNCNCSGDFMDEDDDEVCDLFDLCPGFDDQQDSDGDGIPNGCDDCDGNQAGKLCNDGDLCTEGDVYDADCECVGIYMDDDNDMVCNAQDLCPGFDDDLDADGDGIPDACDDCDGALVGTTCDDNDGCTTNDIFDASCNCIGTLVDVDNDGLCFSLDPNDNDACIPDTNNMNCVNYCYLENAEDFEASYGIWNKGGNDALRIIASGICSEGTYCIRLRSNSGQSSSIFTNKMDLLDTDSIKIAFNYFPTDMEAGEKFYLETSSDGGTNFTIYKTWEAGLDFENYIMYAAYESLTTVDFSSEFVLRLRCGATDFSDAIYLDEIEIEICDTSILTTGTNQQWSTSYLDIDLFPNPTTSGDLLQMTVGTDLDFADVQILNIVGELVTSFHLENIKAETTRALPVQLSEEGIYIISFYTDKGVVSKKVIVIPEK